MIPLPCCGCCSEIRVSTIGRLPLIENENNTIFVSAVSAFEIAYKFRIGKLPAAEFITRNLGAICSNYDLQELGITVRHGTVAGSLTGEHRDPFDRLLAAQSLSDGLPLMTRDPAFAVFGVEIVW